MALFISNSIKKELVCDVSDSITNPSVDETHETHETYETFPGTFLDG
ncbi:hypothetical protein [Castellaniella sp.]